MAHLLLNKSAIDKNPADYLKHIGHVFAEFGAPVQDSGNVSYGIEVGGERYFVKTAGDPGDSKSFLGHSERVALLRNAARVARTCAHPALAKLLQMIESPAGPMLVYEWVEGELLHASGAYRDDPQSAFQRFRKLPPQQIGDCLGQVYGLHRDLAKAGWVAVDFYDGSLMVDFESGRIKVMDVDHYHMGPFRNEMGRMFGSKRIMAPEEFELGAMIDEQTTVYTMGRTAAVFLSDGSLAEKTFRGSGALHKVIVKACQPERERRFGSMQEFYNAWRGAESSSGS